MDIEGLRFRDGDQVTGRDSWKASSRLIRKAAAAKKAAAGQGASPRQAKQAATQGGRRAEHLRARGHAQRRGPVAQECRRGHAHRRDRPGDDSRSRSTGWPMARPVSLLNDRVRAQRVFPHAPLSEGPNQQDFPAAAADSQGAGAWVAAVWHEPRGPELLPAVTEQPKNFAEFVPTGGGDQVRLAPLPGRQGRRAARRHRARPRRLAPRRGHRRRRERRRRLDRETRRQLGPLQPPLRPQDQRRSRPEQRITDQPGTDTDAVLATAADGTVWMAWQAWTGGQADILLAPLDGNGKLGAPPIKVSDTPANEWAPAHRGRRERPGPRRVRQLPDRQLRRHAPDPAGRRHARPADHRGRHAAYEARPSLAADPRGRVWVAYEERTPNWGKDAVNLLDGKGSSLYRASKVVVAVRRRRARPRRARSGRARARPAQDHEQLSPAGRRSRGPALAGVPPPPGGDLGQQRRDRRRRRLDRARHVALGHGVVGPAALDPERRPARQPPGPGPARRGAGPGVLQHRRPAAPRGRDDTRARPCRYFTNQGTPPGVFNVDLEVSALAADRAVRRAAPEPGARPAAEPVRSRPPRRGRGPRPDAGATGSRPAARPTGCCAASSTAIPRSPPTAAPTARSKTCGAMRSTPPGSTGSATATTTTAAARNTPGG